MQYHSEEVDTKSGEIWFGLFPEQPGQFELKPAKVTISLVNDPIVDDPDQKTGKKVSIPSTDEPLSLVRGVAGLKAGGVTTCVARTERLTSGQRVKLKLGSSEATLIVTGTKQKDQEMQSDYALILERDGVRQKLYSKKEIGSDLSQILLWSGDLDRDGKVDLLIDTTEHYNMSRPTLFLSSKAKPGKLVEKVASRTSVGC
ncbi:MAG: hypothetical protein K8F91_15625 [Candidatus Obscuribacterales bacterium]|nr:hypothetical protein [Candidatus Obscuribacterales bacterium]